MNIKKLNKLDDENEIKEQNETFKISDLNHDGNLNKEEANWAFMDLGYTFSSKELNRYYLNMVKMMFLILILFQIIYKKIKKMNKN